MCFRYAVLLLAAVQIVLAAPACEQVRDYRKKVYYERGLKLYEQELYREALEQFQYAREFADDYRDAIVMVGLCQYELKNYRQAATSLEGILFIDEEHCEDLLLISVMSRMKLGQFNRVMRLAESILGRDADNAQARYLYALARLRSRRATLWSDVEAVLRPLLAGTEFKSEAFVLLAEFRVLTGNLEDAERILMAHVGTADTDEWFFVMRFLADRYEAQRDYDAAARIYRTMLHVNPDSSVDTQRFLDFLRRSGRSAEEQQVLESLLDADDKNGRIRQALIDFYLHYGRFTEVEEQAYAGLRQGSNDLGFLRRLIHLYEYTGRYDDGIRMAKKAIAQAPEGSDLKFDFKNILARLYYLTNNLEIARVAVRWVLDVDPDNPDARFLLARIALDEGRTLLAIGELRGLAAEDSLNSEYDYYKGLAHLARNESGNAEQSFRSALRKDPGFKPSLLKIAEIYLERGFYVDLGVLIDSFLEKNPGDPDVLALREQLEMTIPVAP